VELYLHDIGGHEIFDEYCPKYCKEATSYMLIFDTTQPESFKDLQKWMGFLRHIKTIKNCKGILIATKLDQTHRRLVSQAEAEEFATRYSLAYFETSVVKHINQANRENIDAPFYYLAHTFHERFVDYLRVTTEVSK
jgi:GTPase SAR1 family protein